MKRLSKMIRAITFGAALFGAATCFAEIDMVAGPMRAEGDFNLDKSTRRSLSGIACPVTADGRHICLVAFDEGVEARTIEIGDDLYAVHGKPVKIGVEDTEMDSEAVAADDQYYYVTGSHANKRKHCAENGSSHRVVRIAYDQSTGLPLRKDGRLKQIDDDYDLAKDLPNALQDAIGKCLGSNGGGLDIEGLAVYDGHLYFGLRGPTKIDPASDHRSIVSVRRSRFRVVEREEL